MFIKDKIGTAYNVPAEEYICDSEEDIKDLPKNAPMGSYALIISTGTVKMKNSEGKWVNLDIDTKNAGAAKSELEAVIEKAKELMDGFSDTVTKASDIKDGLDASIEDAGTIKTELENTKSGLDTSIENAKNAKSDLDTSISDAETKKTELETAVNGVETVKSDLDASIKTANETYSALLEENASAESNLEELKAGNFNGQEILADIANLEAYLGLTDDVLGLEVDYKNKTFTRLAGAVGKTPGKNFDSWNMYGKRKKCNVLDDGTITAYYGDANYKEDGTNGQVMIYQPKFYYLVAPVVYDAQKTGVGYHLRKANYYISDKSRAGFKLHPAFYDANGNEVDYVLIGAYEACIYDTSDGTYARDDNQIMSVEEDLLSSIADAKPASGFAQAFTRSNVEKLAQNRGENWHGLNVKIASMEQLLTMIELGTMNFQTTIGQGVVSITDNPLYNCASFTGSTASLGNGTGRAKTTINDKYAAQTEETEDGKTSICYRGVENDWGNIWKHVDGVNIWGNGTMAGGEPYVCKNFSYDDSKNTDNYEGAGFTVANSTGYINAMGYSKECDWLFMGSEINGNSSLPVGDSQYVTPDLNDYRLVRLGGYWPEGVTAGGFCWALTGAGGRNRYLGGRLVYVPTSNT